MLLNCGVSSLRATPPAPDCVEGTWSVRPESPPASSSLSSPDPPPVMMWLLTIHQLGHDSVGLPFLFREAHISYCAVEKNWPFCIPPTGVPRARLCQWVLHPRLSDSFSWGTYQLRWSFPSEATAKTTVVSSGTKSCNDISQRPAGFTWPAFLQENILSILQTMIPMQVMRDEKWQLSSKDIVWASEFNSDRTSFHFHHLINFSSFSLPSSFSFLYYSLVPVVDFFLSLFEKGICHL